MFEPMFREKLQLFYEEYLDAETAKMMKREWQLR